MICLPVCIATAPARRYFFDSDYDVQRRVVITGVDDDEADGNIPYGIVMTSSSSEFYGHGGVAASATLSLVNIDDDFVSVLVEPAFGASGLVTSEDGDAVAVTVSLSYLPSNNATVTVFAASSDSTEVGQLHRIVHARARDRGGNRQSKHGTPTLLTRHTPAPPGFHSLFCVRARVRLFACLLSGASVHPRQCGPRGDLRSLRQPGAAVPDTGVH